MRVDVNLGCGGLDCGWWCGHRVLGECVVIVWNVVKRGLGFASVSIEPAFCDGAYHAGVGDGLKEAEGSRWMNPMSFCEFQGAFEDVCRRVKEAAMEKAEFGELLWRHGSGCTERQGRWRGWR